MLKLSHLFIIPYYYCLYALTQLLKLFFFFFFLEFV